MVLGNRDLLKPQFYLKIHLKSILVLSGILISTPEEKRTINIEDYAIIHRLLILFNSKSWLDLYF